MDAKTIKHAVVVGAGVMGNGIAQVLARAGLRVGLVDVDEAALGRALKRMESDLDTLAEHGSLARADIPGILDRVTPSRDLGAMAERADFVIEAVPEVPETKKEVFSLLDRCCPEHAVIASNTSGLDIFSMAPVKNPGRLVIAHWFAPAHIIPLVEVIPGPGTDSETVDVTASLMERIGKETLVLAEFIPSPCSLVNRIQNAMVMPLIEILQQGWASPEEIDRAFKLSLGIRLPIVGLMQGVDFNGLDVLHGILQNLGISVPQVDEKVSQGHLGVKTGRGIYDYGGRSEDEILRKRDLLYLQMIEHLSSTQSFGPI